RLGAEGSSEISRRIPLTRSFLSAYGMPNAAHRPSAPTSLRSRSHLPRVFSHLSLCLVISRVFSDRRHPYQAPSSLSDIDSIFSADGGSASLPKQVKVPSAARGGVKRYANQSSGSFST